MTGNVVVNVMALGERVLLEGYKLAGANLHIAETDQEVRKLWADIPGQTSVVLLTQRAAKALGPLLLDPDSPLTVVLPK